MSTDEPSETNEAQDSEAWVLEPPPTHVGELAVACIGYVQRTLGVELDFTPETLPLLDHWLRSAAEELRRLPTDKAEDPYLDAVAAPAGAYLGEVVRRLVPARWFAPPGEYRLWRIELANVFLSFNPVGVAMEAIAGQEVEGFGAFFRLHPAEKAIAERALANLPEVDVEEYFSPSSRVETLQIVADAIAGAHQAEPQAEGPRTYGDADYGPVRTEAIGAALPAGQGPIEA